MKRKHNSILLFLLIISTISTLSSCNLIRVRNTSIRNYSAEDPRDKNMPINAGLDFVELHNDVLTSMLGQYTPFFFIVNDGFVISGTNDPKVITINITCLEGTVKQDVDLVLSMALNYIGIYSSDQLFKYKAPNMDSDNTYIDFGTVFNEYDLSVEVKDTKGGIINSFYTKAGNKIPVDPRYIMED